MIRAARPADASAICEIYNRFVSDSIATFEETPVEASEMVRRIEDTVADFPWYVWEQSGQIEGYAYASRWMSRSAYRFSTETTVYVSPARLRRGIGGSLCEALLGDLRTRNVHAAIAGIALPNPASVALHEKLGFRKVSEFREVGYKFGRWINVGHWELLL